MGKRGADSALKTSAQVKTSTLAELNATTTIENSDDEIERLVNLHHDWMPPVKKGKVTGTKAALVKIKEKELCRNSSSTDTSPSSEEKVWPPVEPKLPLKPLAKSTLKSGVAKASVTTVKSNVSPSQQIAARAHSKVEKQASRIVDEEEILARSVEEKILENNNATKIPTSIHHERLLTDPSQPFELLQQRQKTSELQVTKPSLSASDDLLPVNDDESPTHASIAVQDPQALLMTEVLCRTADFFTDLAQFVAQRTQYTWKPKVLEEQLLGDKKKIQKRPVKDPNEPKRPLSAYNLWCDYMRKKFKERDPDKSLTLMDLAEMWKNLDDKSRWEQVAKENKSVYEQQLAAYKATIHTDGIKSVAI